MKSNIIISDITCMKDKFCVAGFDVFENKMKRLLIDDGYWSLDNIKKIKTYGSILVDTYPLEHPRDYPQRTEDINIDFDSIEVLQNFDNAKDIAKSLEKSVSKSIQSIFNGNVKERSYILPKTKCASLGAIILPSEDISFTKENGKLRCIINDRDGEKYCLRVSCKYIRKFFDENQDVDILNQTLKTKQFVHIRIGLARPFLIQDKHCFLMVNGLFLY